MAKNTPTDQPDATLQAAWEAFLVRAEAAAHENGTIHIFEEQKARGEFDKIPPEFKG